MKRAFKFTQSSEGCMKHKDYAETVSAEERAENVAKNKRKI